MAEADGAIMARVGRVIEVERASTVAATPEAVWAVVSTMAGVNAELAPWVRMTHPADRASLDEQDVPLGEVLFPSWLLAFGVVPFDRHSLVLTSIEPGQGFVEESTSWLQRRWRHERTLEPAAGGRTTVTDRLAVEPRVGLSAPITRRVVGWLFTRRHHRLRSRFVTL